MATDELKDLINKDDLAVYKTKSDEAYAAAEHDHATLTIQQGGDTKTYDGSEPVTVEIAAGGGGDIMLKRNGTSGTYDAGKIKSIEVELDARSNGTWTGLNIVTDTGTNKVHMPYEIQAQQAGSRTSVSGAKYQTLLIAKYNEQGTGTAWNYYIPMMDFNITTGPGKGQKLQLFVGNLDRTIEIPSVSISQGDDGATLTIGTYNSSVTFTIDAEALASATVSDMRIVTVSDTEAASSDKVVGNVTQGGSLKGGLGSAKPDVMGKTDDTTDSTTTDDSDEVLVIDGAMRQMIAETVVGLIVEPETTAMPDDAALHDLTQIIFTMMNDPDHLTEIEQGAAVIASDALKAEISELVTSMLADRS